jgi:hypothetical protein
VSAGDQIWAHWSAKEAEFQTGWQGDWQCLQHLACLPLAIPTRTLADVLVARP